MIINHEHMAPKTCQCRLHQTHEQIIGNGGKAIIVYSLFSLMRTIRKKVKLAQMMEMGIKKWWLYIDEKLPIDKRW